VTTQPELIASGLSRAFNHLQQTSQACESAIASLPTEIRQYASSGLSSLLFNSSFACSHVLSFLDSQRRTVLLRNQTELNKLLFAFTWNALCQFCSEKSGPTEADDEEQTDDQPTDNSAISQSFATFCVQVLHCFHFVFPFALG